MKPRAVQTHSSGQRLKFTVTDDSSSEYFHGNIYTGCKPRGRKRDPKWCRRNPGLPKTHGQGGWWTAKMDMQKQPEENRPHVGASGLCLVSCLVFVKHGTPFATKSASP